MQLVCCRPIVEEFEGQEWMRGTPEESNSGDTSGSLVSIPGCDGLLFVNGD